MSIQRLRDILQAKMAEARLRPRSLARKAGLNETAVRDILKGRSKNPKMDTLGKLSAALGTDIQRLASDLQAIPILGTTPASGTVTQAGAGRATPQKRPRSRLGAVMTQRGLTIKDVAARTKIPAKRITALANGAEANQQELDKIAEALDLGVFDIFDFSPMTRDEAQVIVELRRMTGDDRRQIRALIARLAPANDPHARDARKRA